MKPFSVPWKSCGSRKSPVVAVQVGFSAVKVLKFSFHNSRGHTMLVDVCLSSVKMR